MPTRKQRRRRAKEFRHEWVWEDEEGRELDPEERPQRSGTSHSRGSGPQRRRREPQAPSWNRSLKRGVIFAPIMLVTVMLLGGDLTLAQQVTQTLLIVAVFVPFSYFLDRLFWRSYQRRQARRGG
jgi:hypothetical protein